MLLFNRLTFMQRIQDAAAHKYTWYTYGTVDDRKYDSLEEKFDALYHTKLSTSARSKRRKAGQAVALFYAWPRNLSEVKWFLLATDGRGLIHEREKLTPLKSGTLTFQGYVLLHDGVSWSWAMTKEHFEYWKGKIHRIAAFQPFRRRCAIDEHGTYDSDIEKVMNTLYNMPGFRLIRQQVGHLVSYAHGEWRRLRPNDGPKIRKRNFLPYAKRMTNKPKDEDVKRWEIRDILKDF